jgi:hypothetical protein
MTSPLEHLAALATRLEMVARVSPAHASKRWNEDANHLRALVVAGMAGTISMDEAWKWCDLSAGQLLRDQRQIEKRRK